MNIKIFDEILSERFYRYSEDLKSDTLKEISNNICNDLGYKTDLLVEFDNNENVAAGVSMNNGIVLNPEFLNPQRKHELCITLIHECIHAVQDFKKEKYEPFITTPLSSSPFYLLQSTEREAFEKSCQIASTFDENFKETASKIFTMNYMDETKAIEGLIKNDFLNEEKVSFKERLLSFTKNPKKLEENDLENYSFKYNRLSDTQKVQLENLMKNFVYEQKAITDFSDLFTGNCNEYNNFKLNDVVVWQTDNLYKCQYGQIVGLDFSIKDNNLNLYNIKFKDKENLSFSYDENDLPRLKDIVKVVNKIKSIYEKDNNVKLNINISDFIFQMNKNERKNFKEYCNEVFTKEDFNLDDKEIMLKSRLEQNIIQNIYFSNTENNIENCLKEFKDFYIKENVFNKDKKLKQLKNFIDIYNNLENKRLAFAELYKNNFNELKTLKIEKIDVAALEAFDKNLKYYGDNYKDNLEDKLRKENEISDFKITQHYKDIESR